MHFDLKCDNVLLDFEAPGHAVEPAGLPFRAVLADFGTARLYGSSQAAVTRRCACLQPA